MVPNHALIILSLLYGEGDFQKSLMIGNTCGWDTDCNSANIGCLMGIRGGLAGIGASLENGADWRGPLADRLYLPTADGGHCVSDAVIETNHIVNAGRALQGLPPVAPKNGARFHFELPGSVQGFVSDSSSSPVEIANVSGHSQTGSRSLALKLASGSGRVATATFIPPADMAMPGYELIASPTLYPGQTVTARLEADAANAALVTVSLFLNRYALDGSLQHVPGLAAELAPGAAVELTWKIEGDGNQPICQVGMELSAPGTIYLDYLTWGGAPDVVFASPEGAGPTWRKAWVNAVDQWETWGQEGLRIIQNEGRGLLITGCREWQDYRVSAVVRPTLMESGGIAARVQGLRRFYALQLVKGRGSGDGRRSGNGRRSGSSKVQLLKALDGDSVLAEVPFEWQMWQPYVMTLEVQGNRLKGWIADQLLFDVVDTEHPLTGGGVALVVAEGHLMTAAVKVQPL